MYLAHAATTWTDFYGNVKRICWIFDILYIRSGSLLKRDMSLAVIPRKCSSMKITVVESIKPYGS